MDFNKNERAFKYEKRVKEIRVLYRVKIFPTKLQDERFQINDFEN